MRRVSDWLQDLAVAILAIPNPALLTRDSLKMCWTAIPIESASPPAPYRVGELRDRTAPIEWINTMTEAGMPVTARTWHAEVVDRLDAKVPSVFADDRLVASAILRPIAGVDDAAHLMWVAVSPAHQGKGLGRVVVAAAMHAAAGRYRTVFLLTDDQRKPAIALYLSLGFKPCLNSWDRTQHLRWQRLSAALNISLPYCREPGHRDAIANMSR